MTEDVEFRYCREGRRSLYQQSSVLPPRLFWDPTHLLGIGAVLSAWRRSCRVDLRRVICDVRTKEYKRCRRAIPNTVMNFSF